MPLSCSCGEWDGDGWAYWTPRDFTTLKTSKRKRCCSCKELINIGADCVEFERFRYPITEVECRIVGDWDIEVELASYWMCGNCGGLFLNLEALGYCIDIEENMRELLKEYWLITGFEPKEM